jgi:hypothetical protein
MKYNPAEDNLKPGLYMFHQGLRGWTHYGWYWNKDQHSYQQTPGRLVFTFLCHKLSLVPAEKQSWALH